MEWFDDQVSFLSRLASLLVKKENDCVVMDTTAETRDGTILSTPTLSKLRLMNMTMGYTQRKLVYL
jgi:kynureninase